MNPHGLTQDAHYVTAYDMYLIFNEAIKYDEFIYYSIYWNINSRFCIKCEKKDGNM